ncbi:MAG: hypothetical protein PHY34_04835 [Patescibacteria group bacterium]|nr:hypothetical protein [Patescibacteria group bacterium]MDD5715605.1 hypothetical protein [Patescibacteria group bacterium]
MDHAIAWGAIVVGYYFDAAVIWRACPYSAFEGLPFDSCSCGPEPAASASDPPNIIINTKKVLMNSTSTFCANNSELN